jgi:hypothetical protein
MLLPIFHGAVTGAVDTVRLYIQPIVDRQEGDGNFSTFYTQSFFQAILIKNLLSPPTWRMEASHVPTDADPLTFHVCHFITSLHACSAHPALLPAQGFSYLEMKPLALFIFTCFHSMDITSGFTTAKFDHSILGQRLRHTIAMLKRHQVQLLWTSNARAMTFVWFKHLQALLYLFQCLATGAMWKHDAGFLWEDLCPHTCPYDQDGRHFVDIVQD